ncbi:hypothetical protein SDC9_151680 [bioreactor metagenome]|uniref:Uncharacterized protein n=1 Tax=bioreactor metagenome TaxID=1076179 RepID=A0A645ETA1_9ZZZZ
MLEEPSFDMLPFLFWKYYVKFSSKGIIRKLDSKTTFCVEKFIPTPYVFSLNFTATESLIVIKLVL